MENGPAAHPGFATDGAKAFALGKPGRHGIIMSMADAPRFSMICEKVL
jgi:hypothetical protein